MKKRIEHLLAGRFCYQAPPLLFSEKNLEISLAAGETRKGEVYFGAEDNRKIRGYITTGDRRIMPDITEFSGTTIRLPYEVNAEGLSPGETRNTFLCFTTSVGEAFLPVSLTVTADGTAAEYPGIHTMEDFRDLAREDFREAYRFFTGSGFPAFLKKQAKSDMGMYQGFSTNPVTYQHLEEYLIANGLKEKVTIQVPEETKNHFSVHESVSETLRIYRSGWGHLRLDVRPKGDFLEVEKRVITDEDFIGSSYVLTYVIRREKLGNNNSCGEIRLVSPYEEKTIRIVASRAARIQVSIRTEEKKLWLGLMKDYVEYLCGGSDFSTWAGSSHFYLNRLKESGFVYPEYRLYEAYVLHTEGKNIEAGEILDSFQEKSFSPDEQDLAGAWLYLCYKTGMIREKEGVVNRLRDYSYQSPGSFLLFYLLMDLDIHLKEDKRKVLQKLEDIYYAGCFSPVLYFTAWKMIKKDMTLFRRVSPFFVQVFLFAGRRGLLDPELAMRLSYLSGYEKTFEEGLYRALVMGYEAYPEDDALEMLCRYIMRGNPRKMEYFRWYSLAVRQGIRLTRLYEYYMETLDISYHQDMPKALMMYFSYNNNNLGDRRKAFLYANVLAGRDRFPEEYESYREAMQEFTLRKLKEGRINEDYASLYQEFIHPPLERDKAASLASLLFTERVYCDDKKVRSVIVRHPALAREEIYPCSQGIAYPRIYTEDAAILFQDEKQRRYSATVNYNRKKLLEEKTYIDHILKTGILEAGVLLYFCENNEITEDNLRFFRAAASEEDFSEEYRKNIRRRILLWCMTGRKGSDLDHFLKSLNLNQYAEADRPLLLSILIGRGLYREAYAIVEEYGAEGLDAAGLLKLTSRMITLTDFAQNEELLSFAGEIYARGYYDEVILKYLMMHRYGSVNDLLHLWNSAGGFDMDSYELEEKILSLLMFQWDYRPEGEQILRSYLRKSGKLQVAGAYLTHMAYGYFVKDLPMTDGMRDYLRMSWDQKWPVNRICHLALFKEAAADRKASKEANELKKALLAECMEDGLVFAFYRKLPQTLLEPYQLDDKTFVECHAAPDAKVTLFYSTDTGLGEKTSFCTRPLQPVYEGIFGASFTLFYGESIRYYFQVEKEGSITRTPERTFTMNRTEGRPVSKYQMLNQILSARKLGKMQEVQDLLKNYLRREQYVEEEFRIQKNQDER